MTKNTDVRSDLIAKHKEAERHLEKELKKKRLPLEIRKNIETKLEELRVANEAELRIFEGGANEDEIGGTEEEIQKNDDLSEETVFEERNWSSLSKSALEDECHKRGLGRKGNKEDLVTRLTVFSVSYKAKVVKAGHPELAVKHADTMDYIPIPVPGTSGPNNKPDYRLKNKKLWKRRGAPRTLKQSDSDNVKTNSKWSRKKQADDEDSDSSDDSSSGDADSSSGDAASSSSESPKKPAALGKAVNQDDRARQKKREDIVAGILAKILTLHPHGIPFNEVTKHLTVSSTLKTNCLSRPKKCATFRRMLWDTNLSTIGSKINLSISS